MIESRTVALQLMSSFPHIAWLYLWIAPHVLLIPVAILMYRRGLHKNFPIFFCYLLFEFLQFCLLFSLRSVDGLSISTYQNIDIFGRIGSIALRFGIIQELFEAPLSHSAPLRQTMSRVLNWVTVILVLLTSLFVGCIYYSNYHALIVPTYVINQALNTAQCGLLALVFLWHRYLNLKMSPLVFGIAIGMGLVAGLEPLMHALKDSLAHSAIVDYLQMAIFHLAVLVWLYFAQAREGVTLHTETALLPHAREWTDDLGRITHL